MFDVSSTDLVLRVVREGLLLVLLVSAPPLLVSMVVGILMGMFQAATQIQDQSLGFVPKLVAVVLCIIVLGPMLSSQLLRFTQALWQAIPNVG
ncbi:MAG: flagellar biosynthesis protein FliQ [Deltaproteobacteria bacterium]|nr:flagellar biosynthesis protein FliQ [Deltaproteobacteria bacterium]